MLRIIGRLATFVLVVGLCAPGTAYAQGPYGPFLPQEDYGPGITVSGGGLARVTAPKSLSQDSIQAAIDGARPAAVGRAVRDARRRAKSIATAAGTTVGAVRSVEVRDVFVDRGRRCRASKPPHCTVPAFVAAGVTATFEIVGGAEPEEDAGTIEAYGTVFTDVEPGPPASEASERSIRRALLTARDTSTPAAVAKARAQVDAAAAAAGTSVGPVVSIVEQFSYYADVALGTVGPRRYCRVLRNRHFLGVDRKTGRPRFKRGPPKRRCFFPRRLTVSIEATYTRGG